MLRPERGFEDGESPKVEPLRLLVPAPGFKEHRKVVGRHRQIGVLGAEQPFLDCQRPQVMLFGLFVAALRGTGGSQVVQVDGDFEMVRAINLLEYGERATVKPFGLLALLLSVQYRRKRGYVRGDVRVIGAERPFPNLS